MSSRGRKKGRTMIATSTPELQRKQEEEEKKNRKLESKVRIVSKRLFDAASSTDKRKCKKKMRGSKGSPNADDDVSCLYCRMQYKRSCESWIQCTECKNWACLPCTDATAWQVDFVCDVCRD